MMTELQQKTLDLAEASIGITEHPPNSNRGPDVDRYLRRVGLDPEHHAYPWCAAFASTMVLDAADSIHLTHRFRGSASVHRLYELNPALQLDVPTDICLFVHLDLDRSRAHDHCGFLVEVATGSSIEGNSDVNGSRTGGSVVRNIRPAAYMTHFLRIE